MHVEKDSRDSHISTSEPSDELLDAPKHGCVCRFDEEERIYIRIKGKFLTVDLVAIYTRDILMAPVYILLLSRYPFPIVG